MNLKHQTIIVVSNPFGFGPTSKALALLEQLIDKWSGKIVYAASQMCQETLPDKWRNMINIVSIDDRDPVSLESLFSKYDNPIILCILNKNAIKTAHSLGLKSFFVDSLTWMWERIPNEYLLADQYYGFDVFNAENKVSNLKNILLIPPITGKLPTKKVKRNHPVLIHIGGYNNPFLGKDSHAYLNLLAHSLSQIKCSNKILITGGKQAIKYLTTKIKGNYILATLKRNDFLKVLNSTPHFITTPGLTAIIEATSLNTPISFLPPTNLSQWKTQTKLYNNSEITSIRWEHIIKVPKSLGTISEAEAIPIINGFATHLLIHNQLSTKFTHSLKKIIYSHKSPPKTKSTVLSNHHKDGAEIVINDIIKRTT